MMNRGLLIVISGPSGAGKGTICKELIRKTKCWLSISATTRSPREGEVDGENYYFLSKDEFIKRVENCEFLEYAQVYNNYYGTPKKHIEEKLNAGIDVILEIDIQGALQVKETYKEGVYIFILPPSMEELKKRIINRGSETTESLNTRFSSAYSELSYMGRYNYAVINDEVEEAVKKIVSIIVAEKCRVHRVKKNFLKEEEK